MNYGHEFPIAPVVARADNGLYDSTSRLEYDSVTNFKLYQFVAIH